MRDFILYFTAIPGTSKTPGIFSVNTPQGSIKFKIWEDGIFRCESEFEFVYRGERVTSSYGEFTREKTWNARIRTLMGFLVFWISSNDLSTVKGWTVSETKNGGKEVRAWFEKYDVPFNREYSFAEWNDNEIERIARMEQGE